MFMKSNYLVDFDMYKGFIQQLNKEKMYINEIVNEAEGSTEKEIHAKRDDKLLCSQILYSDGRKSQCYIYADPNVEDAMPAQPVRQIVLTTPQQVQELINNMKKLGLM